MLIAGSCEEDPTKIGEGILPGSDFVSISSTDTISVRTYTAYSDSIKSDNPAYSYIGQLHDSYFGTTTAEFVSQMRLGGLWTEGTYTIDSIKLFLSFRNVSGNVAAGHKLLMSEISDQLYTDSSYYSNKTVHHSGYTMELTLPALRADTVNDIELKIPVDFGTYITRNTAMFFHSTSEPDFMSYFKGFHFQLIPDANPVFITLSVAPTQYFGVYSNQIIMYMHDETSSSVSFNFIFDSYVKNASFNIYKHDYTTADPAKSFSDKINKKTNDTLTYLQGLNGVFTKVLLPGLEAIKNDPLSKGISVNKARLVFPYYNTGTGYAQSSLPSRLLMSFTDNSGVRYYVPDYVSSSSFYDGTIDTVKGVYNFNISSFVQNYIRDTKNSFKPEIDLFVQSSSTQKVIMRANGNSKPVKFEFTYTKF